MRRLVTASRTFMDASPFAGLSVPADRCPSGPGKELRLNRVLSILGRWLQRCMVRTNVRPFCWAWSTFYFLVARAACLAIRLRHPSALIYLRGSFASGTQRFGVSDLDLVAVTRTDAMSLRNAATVLYTRLPALKGLAEVTALSQAELHRAVSGPFQTWSAHAPSLAYDDGIMPDGGSRLYGPHRTWRSLGGHDLLAAIPAPPEELRFCWAWADMRFAWKNITRQCLGHKYDFRDKAIFEAARNWLLLSEGVICTRNEEIAARMMERFPEEASLFRAALALRRAMRRSLDLPDDLVPLADVTQFLWRMTCRMADRLDAAAASRGGVEVALVGELPDHESGALPYLDWAGIVLPGATADSFNPLRQIDTVDPTAIASFASALDSSLAPDGLPQDVLMGGNLLLRPTTGRNGPRIVSHLRTLQSTVTDPAMFALAEGRTVCRFSDLPGWSASACASRAVAEHRRHLASPQWKSLSLDRRRSSVTAAMRAVTFHKSLNSEEPVLPVTEKAAIEWLSINHRSLRSALQNFREHSTAPELETIAASLFMH